jgi:hypothetical protein
MPTPKTRRNLRKALDAYLAAVDAFERNPHPRRKAADGLTPRARKLAAAKTLRDLLALVGYA